MRLYSRTARAGIVVLLGLCAAGTVGLAALAAWANDPPLVPAVLHRLALSWIVVPAGVAVLLRRRARATARVEDGMLVFERTGLRIEVPCGAITALTPWRVPLPEPALIVRLRSGRRLTWSVGSDDPAALLERLTISAAAEPAAVASETGVIRYARARATGWSRSVWRLLAKFPGFGALVATPLFVTHQWIAYGGPLGQLYLEGVAAWTTTAAVYWSTVTIYLGLWAGVWRGLAETTCWGLALILPGGAAGCRRVAEWVCRGAYFVVVPLLVLLRYLA